MPPAGLGMGDWPCRNPDCDNINFARRTMCNYCKWPKFQPSLADWKCWCGNYNRPSRKRCTECKSDRPSNDRRGRGGGYNERGDVEYKQKKKEKEGGGLEKYDDLGRLKKKYRIGKKPSEISHSRKSSSSNSSHDKDRRYSSSDTSGTTSRESKTQRSGSNSQPPNRRSGSKFEDNHNSKRCRSRSHSNNRWRPRSQKRSRSNSRSKGRFRSRSRSRTPQQCSSSLSGSGSGRRGRSESGRIDRPESAIRDRWRRDDKVDRQRATFDSMRKYRQNVSRPASPPGYRIR